MSERGKKSKLGYIVYVCVCMLTNANRERKYLRLCVFSHVVYSVDWFLELFLRMYKKETAKEKGFTEEEKKM